MGRGHWRVLRIRDSRVETFFEEADGNYTRNLPVSTAIPAGADVQKTLDPNGPDSEGMPWRGLAGRRVTFESGDTVVVVYDVPPTLEARGLGVLRGVSVWYGVTAAHTTVR